MMNTLSNMRSGTKVLEQLLIIPNITEEGGEN